MPRSKVTITPTEPVADVLRRSSRLQQTIKNHYPPPKPSTSQPKVTSALKVINPNTSDVPRRSSRLQQTIKNHYPPPKPSTSQPKVRSALKVINPNTSLSSNFYHSPETEDASARSKKSGISYMVRDRGMNRNEDGNRNAAGRPRTLVPESDKKVKQFSSSCIKKTVPNSSVCYATPVTPKIEGRLLTFDSLGMPKWDDALVEFVANSERRVTRSVAASFGKSTGKARLIGSNKDEIATHLADGKKTSRKQRLCVPRLPAFPDDEIATGIDSRKQDVGKTTHLAHGQKKSKPKTLLAPSLPANIDDKMVTGNDSRNQGVAKPGKEFLDTPGMGKKICIKVSGVKRKRKEISVVSRGGTEQGWTKEQEKALQVAYLSAKPTPQFWKKVAKLVPGKSAQDCFNKVHSLNLTPTLTHLRSRTKGKNLSPQCEISFSAVFEEDKPKGRKKKTSSKSSRKSHNALKTVRYLLKKHTHQNKNSEGDLFSLLEPTAASSDQLSTPIRKMEKISSPTSVGMRSSSSGKKPLSRFSGGACGTAIVSPPVLKPIKNIALHEKYVDLLHAREAKRKAGRNKRQIPLTQAVGSASLNSDTVLRAAKDCLVSDAMDAIAKFKQSQVDLSKECPDDDMEAVFVDEDNDEAEDLI